MNGRPAMIKKSSIFIALFVFLAPSGQATAACSMKVYSSTGSYAGKIESSGKVYLSSGSYAGKIQDNGKIYDDKGAYVGKIESGGSIYDLSLIHI